VIFYLDIRVNDIVSFSASESLKVEFLNFLNDNVGVRRSHCIVFQIYDLYLMNEVKMAISLGIYVFCKIDNFPITDDYYLVDFCK